MKYLHPRLTALSVLLLIVLVHGPVQAQSEQRLTIAEAVKLALKQNTQIRLEQVKIDEAEATRKSTRALFGPRLILDANVLIWDSAQDFDLDMSSLFSMDMSNMDLTKLGLTPAEMTTLLKYNDILQLVPKLLPALTGGSDAPAMTVRDQVTAQIQVVLAQPLTPLIPIHKGYTATKLMKRAAGQNLAARRVTVAQQVTDTYLKVMQTKRFVALAGTGVKQVEAHLARAKHFHKAGLIGKQQVLKAQLELARARERVIKARYGVSLATSGLAMLMGLSPMAKVITTEQVQDPPPAMTRTLKQCIKTGLSQRSEIKALTSTHKAALAGKDAAWWGMLPQVSVMATYQHNWGQDTFMPADTFFAGGMLKWEVWDWGQKYFAMKAAGHKARQAELGKRLLRDGVMMQVKTAYLALKQADQALAVSRKAIKEAEENFRIEQRRFESNTNTSTEVLDAQLSLIRTQLTYTTSLYSHYIARAALKAAMGQI